MPKAYGGVGLFESESNKMRWNWREETRERVDFSCFSCICGMWIVACGEDELVAGFLLCVSCHKQNLARTVTALSPPTPPTSGLKEDLKLIYIKKI